MEPKICTEVSKTNYELMPRTIPEARKHQPEGSLLFSQHADRDKYSLSQPVLFVCID
jgi:hypothetical protein